MARKLELRLLTLEDAMNDKPLLELPVSFEGDRNECEQYAAQQGYVWTPDRQLLFGGYFYNKSEGSKLLPT